MTAARRPLTRRARVWVKGALGGVCIAVGALLVASAYGGIVDPRSWALPAVLAMCFPGLVLLELLLTGVAVVARNRVGWMSALVAFAVALPALLTYSPLHLTGSASTVRTPGTFTIMTFNALWWQQYGNDGPPVTPNPSLQCVIDQNPDILCTQENRGIRYATDFGATKAQIDTILARYPYTEVVSGYDGLTIYSRYPITRIAEQDIMSASSVFACYRVSIDGRLLNVVNCHLQSLSLDDDDKAAFVGLTKGEATRGVLREVKGPVMHKVAAAMRERAEQAHLLAQAADSIGGPMVLCGDFNDIPGCYAVRTLEGAGLLDAYGAAGFGPAITFKAHRLYFRIDHILYRGPLQPVKAWRGGGSSDHYPLLATFRWTD